MQALLCTFTNLGITAGRMMPAVVRCVWVMTHEDADGLLYPVPRVTPRADQIRLCKTGTSGVLVLSHAHR